MRIPPPQEISGAELLVSAVPYVGTHDLKKEYLLVVMGSDGLFDVMVDSEAVKLVSDIIKRASGGVGGWRPTDLGVRDAADSLIQTALNRGTQDNATALVLAFQWDT